ncbi:DUF6099 family protein [Kitasatospora sp. NBC_01539]|uniref:DUF6099 family protein n=1 Tax=Kitasatospora sp. NBC_01539 TaxID=2903577 RepID=UPI0038601388
MDALRLIKTARHTLAQARTASDVLEEARQTVLLIEAVGIRIAHRETGEIGALGQLLRDAGSHAVACLARPPDDTEEAGPRKDHAGDPHDRSAGGARVERPSADRTAGVRAERLDGLGELEPLLHELGSLLHEVAEALVVLACGADAETVYWQCIDGVDAGAECKDLVAELLRTVRRDSGAAPQDAGEADDDRPPAAGPGTAGPSDVSAQPGPSDLPVQAGAPGVSGLPDPLAARPLDRRQSASGTAAAPACRGRGLRAGVRPPAAAGAHGSPTGVQR